MGVKSGIFIVKLFVLWLYLNLGYSSYKVNFCGNFSSLVPSSFIYFCWGTKFMNFCRSFYRKNSLNFPQKVSFGKVFRTFRNLTLCRYCEVNSLYSLILIFILNSRKIPLEYFLIIYNSKNYLCPVQKTLVLFFTKNLILCWNLVPYKS